MINQYIIALDIKVILVDILVFYVLTNAAGVSAGHLR